MKTLSTYIRQYHVFPAKRLFTDDGAVHCQFLEKDPHSIYFVVKTRKLRFLPTRCRVGINYKIHCAISDGNAVLSGAVDMAAFWHMAPLNQQHFPTKHDMADYYLNRGKPGWLSNIPSHLWYWWKTAILSKTPDTELTIDCALKKNMVRERDGLTQLHVHQMANAFEWKVHHPLEIIYIGKSDKDTFRRLEKHEKWGRMLTSLQEEEEPLVFFMRIETNEYNATTISNAHVIAVENPPLSGADQTRIAEMGLINYFSPAFNDHHTARDIQETKIARQLARQGYNNFQVEVKLEGPLGKVGTVKNGYGEHTANFALIA